MTDILGGGSGPRELVTVYQSSLYAKDLSDATRRLQAEGYGRIQFIDAVPGDRPIPGENEASLDRMRQHMLAKGNDVSLAIFIGGMDGISREYITFRDSFEDRPIYAFGRPGGAAHNLARELLESSSEHHESVDLRHRLLLSPEYGLLMDEVLADAAGRLRDG
jgi:hypothetical protein